MLFEIVKELLMHKCKGIHMPKDKNKKTNDSKALPLDGVLVFDYKPTIKSINGLMKQSAEQVLKIGEVLFDAKTEATKVDAMDDYDSMFNHLRFTKATGDKFIKIFTTLLEYSLF